MSERASKSCSTKEANKKKLTYTLNDMDKKMLEAVPDPEGFRQYREDFYAASTFKKRFDYPIHLDIELHNACNFSCAFCEHGFDPKPEFYQTLIKLPKEDVFDILDQASEMGVKSVQLNLVNEPLMYRNLIEVIEYASKLKFQDIYFLTNGSPLTEKKAEALIKSGLTRIMISLDAHSADVFEKIRRRKDYEKIKNNILNFIKKREELNSKLPLVRTSFLVTDINKHQVNDFIEYWSDKADFIAIQNLMSDESSEVKNLKNIENLKGYRCNMPLFRLSIKADGRITPCCVFDGNLLTMGDIQKVSLKELWNSQKMKKFQDMHWDYSWDKNPVCKQCVLKTNFNAVENEIVSKGK